MLPTEAHPISKAPTAVGQGRQTPTPLQPGSDPKTALSIPAIASRGCPVLADGGEGGLSMTQKRTEEPQEQELSIASNYPTRL